MRYVFLKEALGGVPSLLFTLIVSLIMIIRSFSRSVKGLHRSRKLNNSSNEFALIDINAK